MDNYLPNYSMNYPKTKREITTKFMPRIERVPKDDKFANRLCKNLTQHLLTFFDYKEICELGKTNVFLMNNAIEYFELNDTWPDHIRKLKLKYNFPIYQGEVDVSLEQAKINKRKYKFPKLEEERGDNYLQYHIDGNRYLTIGNTFEWAHKNNDDYWQSMKLKGSYIDNDDVYYLDTVCWIDIHFFFYHVTPNNYKVYLNEFFFAGKRFINKLNLNIKIGKNKNIFKADFPSNEIFNNNNGPKENAELNQDFICYIKKEDFDGVEKDINGDCVVEISFSHKDLFWKGGWYIDGASLVEISQSDLEKETKKEED